MNSSNYGYVGGYSTLQVESPVDGNSVHWVILGAGVKPFAELHKHRTRELAETEAKRLAKTNPGVRFNVLKVEAAFQTNAELPNLIK